MELKEGYKQTEIGIIPKDWNYKLLGEIGQFKNGINKLEDEFGYGFPFVNLMDVFGKSSIKTNENLNLVNSNESERKLYNLKKGDVLFIRSSVKPSGVGLTCVIEEDLPETVFSGFIIRFREKDLLTTDYKKYCFYSESFRSKLISNSTVSANTNINQESLTKLLIAYPNKTEQTAIANVLSDTDDLISNLEKLIAKKRNIKLGAMQELLTGKKRLPGFSGEWEVRKLGTVVDILDNLRVPLNESQRIKMRGDIPYCGANGIVDYINEYLINDDIILIAEDGGYFDEYKTRPIAYRFVGKCWVNNHAHILKAISSIDQGFLFFSLVHKNILDFISGGTRSKLNRGSLIS